VTTAIVALSNDGIDAAIGKPNGIFGIAS